MTGQLAANAGTLTRRLSAKAATFMGKSPPLLGQRPPGPITRPPLPGQRGSCEVRSQRERVTGARDGGRTTTRERVQGIRRPAFPRYRAALPYLDRAASTG